MVSRSRPAGEALCAATGDCWQTGGLRGKGPNLSAGRVHKDVTNLYKDVTIFQSKKMHKSVHFRDNVEGGWPVHPGQYIFKKYTTMCKNMTTVCKILFMHTVVIFLHKSVQFWLPEPSGHKS